MLFENPVADESDWTAPLCQGVVTKRMKCCAERPHLVEHPYASAFLGVGPTREVKGYKWRLGPIEQPRRSTMVLHSGEPGQLIGRKGFE